MHAHIHVITHIWASVVTANSNVNMQRKSAAKDGGGGGGHWRCFFFFFFLFFGGVRSNCEHVRIHTCTFPSDADGPGSLLRFSPACWLGRSGWPAAPDPGFPGLGGPVGSLPPVTTEMETK